MKQSHPSEMKSSKLQASSSRETSSTNYQVATPRIGSPTWWREQSTALILHEDQPDIPRDQHPFDLEERTAIFGENIVRFSRKVPRDPTNNRLIDQLVGCGTSVGANYCEANECVSKRDFRNSIARCKK